MNVCKTCLLAEVMGISSAQVFPTLITKGSISHLSCSLFIIVSNLFSNHSNERESLYCNRELELRLFLEVLQ